MVPRRTLVAVVLVAAISGAAVVVAEHDDTVRTTVWSPTSPNATRKVVNGIPLTEYRLPDGGVSTVTGDRRLIMTQRKGLPWESVQTTFETEEVPGGRGVGPITVDLDTLTEQDIDKIPTAEDVLAAMGDPAARTRAPGASDEPSSIRATLRRALEEHHQKH